MYLTKECYRILIRLLNMNTNMNMGETSVEGFTSVLERDVTTLGFGDDARLPPARAAPSSPCLSTASSLLLPLSSSQERWKRSHVHLKLGKCSALRPE